ncbi:MAG: hypothetical protein H7Z41_14995 [Cytophagales bacterium]|nr:hypothetical protein [Armatimonadota bacterium]
METRAHDTDNEVVRQGMARLGHRRGASRFETREAEQDLVLISPMVYR